MLAAYSDSPALGFFPRIVRPARRFVRRAPPVLGASEGEVERHVKSVSLGIILGVVGIFALLIYAGTADRPKD